MFGGTGYGGGNLFHSITLRTHCGSLSQSHSDATSILLRCNFGFAEIAIQFHARRRGTRIRRNMLAVYKQFVNLLIDVDTDASMENDKSPSSFNDFLNSPSEEDTLCDFCSSIKYDSEALEEFLDVRSKTMSCLWSPREPMRWARVRRWHRQRTIFMYWLGRATERACAPDGPARKRDRRAFELDFCGECS